jgi:uncharacterized protein
LRGPIKKPDWNSRPRHPTTLGVERLGLAALRAPVLSIAAFVIVAIAAVFGMERIEIDDSLSQLFRADTPEFRQFEEVSRQFPSSEYDLLVVVEGRTLLERDSIEKLRSLVTDLQLIDGAHGAISMFSARQPSGAGGIPAPLFPEELPQEAEYRELARQVASNELVRGKLLSEDGTLALIVLSFLGLLISDSQLIRAFGEAAPAASLAVRVAAPVIDPFKRLP